ncbi:MAG: peptidoglycan-binding protein [Synechococcales bacterium]|nr:peptidoglycan-binding protein [Synechococcales bacterium]
MSLFILGLGDVAQALQKGEASAGVTNLQQQMVDAGCYGGPVTGFYGELTQAGILACQRQLGLVEDGVPGPQTLAALADPTSPASMAQPSQPQASHPQASQPKASQPQASQLAQVERSTAPTPEAVLRRGDRGSAVLELQQKLQRLNYYTGELDGIFGAQTERAVRALQTAVGLPTDGVVGTQEQAVLDEGNLAVAQPENPPIADQITRNRLVRGDSGSDVEKLQRSLKAIGLLESSVSGYYGSLTQSAVSEFQRGQRLEVTGIADATTLMALGLKFPSSKSSTGIPQSSFNLPPTQLPAPSTSPTIALPPSPTPMPDVAIRDRSGVFSPGSFTNAQTNTPVQKLPEMPRSQRFRYRVVVPEQSQTLAEVRRVVRGAHAYSEARGNFFLLGSYTNRQEADRSAMVMRAYGLDARVEFE